MSKTVAAGAGGATKSKGGKAKDAADARAKEECVAFIVDLLMANIDQHIRDKFIFPQTLCHAVARTMAEMVNMVSIAHVQRMETWLVHLEGSAPEEWDKPQEPLIPLIDSWARGVVPIKQVSASRCSSASVDPSQQQEDQTGENVKQPRRASAMALSQYPDHVPRRRSSDLSSKQGLRGSLRRFSESLYPLDPNRKVKFQEKSPNEAPKDAQPNRRSSTPPPTDFFQGTPALGQGVLEIVDDAAILASTEENKGGKSKKTKAMSPTKK